LKINSVLEYLNYLALNEFEDIDVYRGQANYEWELIPSIARITNPRNSGELMHSNWQEVEDYLLETFQSHSTPFMNFKPENKYEWLVHAQHHGLPTALLDWTTNPLKGLYFAVENPDFDSTDGVVFLGSRYSYSPSTDILKESEAIICFQSKHINERLIAQEGSFSLFPIPDEWDDFKPLSEQSTHGDTELFIGGIVNIPGQKKENIRKELRRFGITHSTLFPGLDGVATSIRREFKS
jgi:hypothetical protein